MKIGVPREIVAGEKRVATTPDVAGQLQKLGFDILVEAGAGEPSNYADNAYREAGCTVVDSTEALWNDADIILKVRGPEPEEADRLGGAAGALGGHSPPP